MRLSARTIANRRNARRSTGPKSAAGKAAVACNALQHGLSVPVQLDPTWGAEIERLTRAIAGEGAGAIRVEGARAIAEAQVDLSRIRAARLALLKDPTARVVDDSDRVMMRTIRAAERAHHIDGERYFERLDRAAQDPDEREKLDRDCEGAWSYFIERSRIAETAREPPPRLDDPGLNALAPQLERLDRYERRALCRRKRAIREYDALATRA